MQQTHNLPKASSILATPTAFNYMEQPDPYIQFLENWIPGISESTELHDQLHDHFGLGYRINDEARILGFQLGHHPAGSIFHVIVFSLMSMLIYPSTYRNTWPDIVDFYTSYNLGKRWQSVSYWFIPTNILKLK